MAQTHNIDLLGHPVPEPEQLPRDTQLTQLQDLIGHTVQWVFEGTDCNVRANASAVIVTETRCFLALQAEEDSLYAINPLYKNELTFYVTAQALVRKGFMGQASAQQLKRAEALAHIKTLRESAKNARQSAVNSQLTAERLESEAAAQEAHLSQEPTAQTGQELSLRGAAVEEPAKEATQGAEPITTPHVCKYVDNPSGVGSTCQGCGDEIPF